MKVKNRVGRCCLKGSYSIEMGMILPLVLFVLVGIIYLVFYLYDISLMRQTVYLAGLRGGYSRNRTEEYVNVVLQYGQEKQKELWAAKDAQFQTEIRGNKIEINCEGRVEVPFGGRYFKNLWDYRIELRMERKRPVQLIRNCRKVEGLLEG